MPLRCAQLHVMSASPSLALLGLFSTAALGMCVYERKRVMEGSETQTERDRDTHVGQGKK